MSNDNTVTVLPDGSAFATASWPLPADHWLYAPRGEWDSERDEFAECPRPILTHAQRDAVVAAVRYAVRGATMCGKETDFDPDAVVQNAVYALCGPFGKAALAAPAPQQPTDAQIREVFLANGFTVKDGRTDLKPYVYDAARALLALAAQAKQVDPVGEVGTMPGTSGFTMACFRAADVPVGTKLYISQITAPSVEQRKPLTHAQTRRCWENAPDHIRSATKSFADFERLIMFFESVYGIAVNQEGKQS